MTTPTTTAPLEALVRRHPLYPALVHRVARCERSWGRYGGMWRRFERCSSYTIGKPYLFEADLLMRFHGANAIAKRMIADIFSEPWPADGDMSAAIYNVARADIDARVGAPIR